MPYLSDDVLPHFWIMKSGLPSGPFDVAQIHEMLVVGVIGWQDRARPVGESRWAPLLETPGVGPIPTAQAAGVNESVSRPLTRLELIPPDTKRSPRPWNPKVIAALGILCTPMWTGVMAAINRTRINSSVPTWVPLAIAFGYLAADLGLGILLDSPLLRWLFYLPAVAVLWFGVLRDQDARFAAWIGEGRPTGNWLWPSVAGAPLAIMTVLSFVVIPLIPPDPWATCEKFLASQSDTDRGHWTTLNLQSSLWVFAKPSSGKGALRWELIGEGAAPPNVGGYLVEFRAAADAGTSWRMTEGIFYLIKVKNRWKIEEVFILRQDGRNFDPWEPMSLNPMLVGQKEKTPLAPGAPPANVAVKPKQQIELGQGINASKVQQKSPLSNTGLYYWLIQIAKSIVLFALAASSGRFFEPASRDKPAPVDAPMLAK